MPPKKPSFLQNLRESLGLSQSDAARLCGNVKQQTWSNAERGGNVSVEIRNALQEIGVSLDWLYTGEGSMFRPGVERIRVERDEQTGKPTALSPIFSGPKNDAAALTDALDSSISPEHTVAAMEMVMQVCREAGKHAELLNARALGRLLVLLAKKVEAGDGEAARAAAVAEARDWVAGLATSTAT